MFNWWKVQKKLKQGPGCGFRKGVDMGVFPTTPNICVLGRTLTANNESVGKKKTTSERTIEQAILIAKVQGYRILHAGTYFKDRFRICVLKSIGNQSLVVVM
ncbi:hypothetical protein ACFSQ7_40830 [Paenibacillus rhizoplanae]